MPRVLHPSILETSSKRSNVFVSIIEVPPSVLTAANSERAAFPQFRKISASRTLLLAHSGGFKSSNCHIGGKRFLTRQTASQRISRWSAQLNFAFAFRATILTHKVWYAQSRQQTLKRARRHLQLDFERNRPRDCWRPQ